jgi:hypothetical protein
MRFTLPVLSLLATTALAAPSEPLSQSLEARQLSCTAPATLVTCILGAAIANIGNPVGFATALTSCSATGLAALCGCITDPELPLSDTVSGLLTILSLLGLTICPPPPTV